MMVGKATEALRTAVLVEKPWVLTLFLYADYDEDYEDYEDYEDRQIQTDTDTIATGLKT